MLFPLAAGGEAAATPDNPLLPVPNEMLYGALAFAAMYFLVKFVLLPPVLQVMEQRSATIEADLDAAESARMEMASASSQLDDQLAEAKDEAQAIIDEARAEGEAERQRLIARAEREVQAMRELADTEVSSARDKAMEHIEPQVSQLAVGAASSILDRNVDLKDAQPVIDRHLSNPN